MARGDAGARKRRRLSRSGEFDRVYRDGSSRSTRYLVLYRFPRDDGSDETRLGISVGRRLGGAVERNRVKRLLREAFWSLERGVPEGHDFVIVARPALAEVAEREGGAGVAERMREVAAAEAEER